MLSPHAPRIPRLSPLQSAAIGLLAIVCAWMPPRLTPSLVARDVSRDERPPGSALLYEERLDVNRATADDFEALPGIGVGRAGEIIALRNRVGGFCSLEELRRAAHVGGHPWKQIEGRVFVGPVPRCA